MPTVSCSQRVQRLVAARFSFEKDYSSYGEHGNGEPSLPEGGLGV